MPLGAVAMLNFLLHYTLKASVGSRETHPCVRNKDDLGLEQAYQNLCKRSGAIRFSNARNSYESDIFSKVCSFKGRFQCFSARRNRMNANP